MCTPGDGVNYLRVKPRGSRLVSRYMDVERFKGDGMFGEGVT